MAQHTETVYASDSWAENYTYTTLIETVRGASLTSQERYSFTSNGSEWDVRATSHSSVHMKFSGSAQYRKKRLKSADLYVYITAAAGSGSGTFKNGRFIHSYDNLLPGGIYSIYTAPAEELSNLGKNQYHRLFSKKNFSDTNLSQGYIEMYPNVYTAYTGSMYNGYQYTSNASMTMHSHTGTNRPYTIFTYEDVVPEVRDCAPKSGFVNEKASTVFRWKFFANQSYVQQPVKQQGYQFRWRVTGQSSYKESTVTSTSESHTVPAGTFPEKGSIDWCVRVQSDDGIWSEWSSWFTLTTTDSIPTTTPISPVDAYVDGSKETIFQWKHSISTGTPQSKYELQYSTDSGQSWKALASASMAQTRATIPANTLPAGRLIWRARTYNSDGVAGDWSGAANFIVRAAPSQPVLTVGQASSRPLLRWQSTNQSSWCLTIVRNGEEIYTTGEMPGDDKSFRVPQYFTNGEYDAKLWIKNLYELQSQTATVHFAIEMETPPKPEFAVETGENKATLIVTGSGFSKYYIFRDDIMIHKLNTPGIWEDYAACGNHSYWIRGVTQDDAFADSNRVRIWVPVFFAQISDVQDLKHPIALKRRRGEYPTLEGELVPQGKSTFYAGRKYPLYEFSEHLSEPLSMSFSYKDRKEFEKLTQIAKNGRPILYRDYRGERRYLVIVGINHTVNPVSYDFTISTERVDYVEAIDYDPV